FIATEGIEFLNLDTQGGSDDITIGDLTRAGIKGAALALGTDGSINTVLIQGSNGPDVLVATAENPGTNGIARDVRVALQNHYDVVISHAAGSDGDTLLVDGHGGDDVLDFSALGNPFLFNVQLFGGDGNDTLRGTSRADGLVGG